MCHQHRLKAIHFNDGPQPSKRAQGGRRLAEYTLHLKWAHTRQTKFPSILERSLPHKKNRYIQIAKK